MMLWEGKFGLDAPSAATSGFGPTVLKTFGGRFELRSEPADRETIRQL
jgi:hypothetical protein